MRPTIPGGTTAMGNWSFNVDKEVHDAINVQHLATLVAALASARGLVPVDPPAGHVNPETIKQEVAAGRYVVSVSHWFRTGPQGLSGADMNLDVARAVMDAGAGTGTPAATLQGGLNDCSNIRPWWQAPLMPWNLIVPEEVRFAQLCAEYRVYQGTAPTAGLNGVVARVTAQPINDSNNANRIGEEPDVFRLPGIGGMSSSELRTVGYVTAGILGLVAIGYAVRSFRINVL